MAAPTAQQQLNVFRTQLGTTENPPGSNSTAYGIWYGMNKVAWCMIFQSWGFNQKQALALIGGKFAYTPSAAAWFQSVDRWSHTPKVGSLAFFDFPDSIDRIQHVEIVEEVRPDGRIVTIGGNTSSDDRGSQDNGDGVWRKVRSTVHVVGYGHPHYSTAGTPTPIKSPIKTPAKPVAIPLLLIDGVWGPATTKAFQRLLGVKQDGVIDKNTRMLIQKWAGLKGPDADGIWGRVTRRAVQRKLGVAADGRWGPITIKALQRFLNRHRNDRG